MKILNKYFFIAISLMMISCDKGTENIGTNGEFLFECNKPSYSSMPKRDSKEGAYHFFTYFWQDDPQICVNTYEGVSEVAKTLITEVINDGKKELGLLVPVNVFAFNNGLSDLNQVQKDWSNLKLATNLDFHDYVAAAGVDWSNMHNGGIIELAHGIFDMPDREMGSAARKIIYHEFFHVHQNSHKFYFENQKNFGFNFEKEENWENAHMIGPVWLEEGGADFAGIYLSGKKGWVDYKFAMTESLDEARSVIADAATRNDIVSLRDYETSDGIKLIESENNPTGMAREFAYQYSAGAWAFAYLWYLNEGNLDGALINYYKNIAEIEKSNIGEGYKITFQQTYGMTLDEFYPQFDAFMLLPREDQIAILKD